MLAQLPNADRRDVTPRELHRVVDRQAGADDAAGRVDVHVDVLVRVLALQVQELRDDQVRRSGHRSACPRKTIRSFRSSEKMSNARSPRALVSTTYGMIAWALRCCSGQASDSSFSASASSALGRLLLAACLHVPSWLRDLGKPVQCLLVSSDLSIAALASAVENTSAHLFCLFGRGARDDLLDLGIDIDGLDFDFLHLRKLRQCQRAFDAFRRRRRRGPPQSPPAIA